MALLHGAASPHLEHGTLPWTHAAISGFVLDPDRKKMSKSKGNVVVPTEVFERHSAGRGPLLGGERATRATTPRFDEQQMKVGRRLAIKILNASRFALSMEAEAGAVTEPLDLAMLAALRDVVGEATEAFDDYEHAKVLDLVERFFWGFTDDYLELVKQRAYGVHGAEKAGSAVAALRQALDVLLRLFAPFLPYVTEEVWSWWREGSVHRAAWPAADELAFAADADPEVYEVAAAALTAIRKEKALAKVSLRVPVERATVRDTAPRLAKLDLVAADLREAGNIEALERARGRRAVGRGRPGPAGGADLTSVRFADALAQLEARQPEHMPGPSLDRIREVVNYLDHPELTYPTIHVTGTNGKTTAARAAAAVACATGVTTGLFTSPHLASVTERFRVCGADMTDHGVRRRMGRTWRPFLDVVDGAGHGEVTYFEAVTALAFLWFADKPVGPRACSRSAWGAPGTPRTWSPATSPSSCPVGIDHVAELGPTLADIAGEKAGIIKEGKLAVVREQEPEAPPSWIAARPRSARRCSASERTGRWTGARSPSEVRPSCSAGSTRPTRSSSFRCSASFAVHNAAAGVVAVEALTGHGARGRGAPRGPRRDEGRRAGSRSSRAARC